MTRRRWGKVDDIDHRTKVGSEAWKARHSNKIQHLSAHRRLHQLSDHEHAREFTDKSVKDKVDEVRRLEDEQE